MGECLLHKVRHYCGVEVISHSRKLHMYPVTDGELDSLQESGWSATIDLSMFSLCIGILVTLIVTITTVDISNSKIFSAYVAVTVGMGLASLFFGSRSIIAWRNARAKLREIKANP